MFAFPTGYIEVNDEVYAFSISNDTVSLGSKVEGINEVEELDINIANTSLLSSNLGSFIYSSYYGGYTSFDSTLNQEILDMFFSSISYDYYGLCFAYSDETTISLYAFYNTSSGIGAYYIDFEEIGNSSNEILESYLS